MRTLARLAIAAGIGMAVLVLGVRPVEAESFSYNVSPAHGPASAPFETWIADTGSYTACNDGWWGYFSIDQPGVTILEYQFDAAFSLKHLVTGITLCDSFISQSAFPSTMTGPWLISMIVAPAAGAKSQEASGDATYTVDALTAPTPTVAPTATPTTASTPTSVATPRTTSSPARAGATATPLSSTLPSTQPAATTTPSQGAAPLASTGRGSGGVPGWLFAVVALLVVVGAGAYYIGARDPAPRPPLPPP